MKKTASSLSTDRVSKDIQLKACPFCGGEAAWADGEQKQKYGNEQVYCTHCYAITAPDFGKEAAASWWNDRAGTQPAFVEVIEANIERLRSNPTTQDTASPKASNSTTVPDESSLRP